MHPAEHRSPWRSDFLAALHLLGQAAALQPYGVSDPVLFGAAAIALYSGDVWPTSSIDVHATNRRVLTAELMALGCRWIERPPHNEPGLWCPQLELGIDITEGRALTPAERTGLLSVIFDLAGPGDAAVRTPRLQVIGIEDLIAAQAACWVGQGLRCGEAWSIIQMLTEIGQAGVGGRFRGAYAQYRLARDTGGEVALDLPARSAPPDGLDSRVTSLSEMAAIIGSWRARHGLAEGTAPPFAAIQEATGRRRAISDRNGRGLREREPSQSSAKVIPFGTALSGAPRSQ